MSSTTPAEIDFTATRTQIELLRAARKFLAEAEAGDPVKYKMVCKKFKVLSLDQIKLRKRRELPLNERDVDFGGTSGANTSGPLNHQAYADWLRSHFEDL